MNQSPNEIFQQIADIVTSLIPEAWTEVNVEAEVDEDLVDMCVWYNDQNDEEKYFKIPRQLADCFVRLQKVTVDEDKGRWTKCLVTISSSGRFSADFSYDPHSWAD